MVNDRNKKLNNDAKNATKRSLVSSSCKPCMPVDRNGSSKEKDCGSKNPSGTNQTSNQSSCYAKCGSSSVPQNSSSTSTTVKPSDSSSRTSSCYAKCGPPSVHQDSSSSAPTSCSGNETCQVKSLNITNPFIEKMEEDILYHIALGNKSHDLVNMFGDVRFVVMGSTPKRMEQFAYFMANHMKYELPPGTILNDISKNSHRYAMFKIGPILSVSHGMGTPSIGILLHELIKLMSHAGVKDPIFVRIGTCGGFSKTAGTVVISNKVVNDFMEPFYELAILGKKVRFPANLNQAVVNEILALSGPEDKFETVAGATYCTDNFYEGSGRADGAICEFSELEGLNYYKEMQKNGVVNVEMESLAFAALTCRAGIKSAIVTVILSDRLETDQVKQSKEILDEWQTRPQKLLAKYIKKKLSNTDSFGSKSDTSKINSTTTCEITKSTTNKPGSCNSSTTQSSISTVDKSCRNDGSNILQTTSSGTSTPKPTNFSSSRTCGSKGSEIPSSVGTSTTKPCDMTSSTTPGSVVCKPCIGTSKTADCTGTTNKPANFVSPSCPPAASICKTCTDKGKDTPMKNEKNSTSDSSVPKCTSFTFEFSGSTAKPTNEVPSLTSSTPGVCKSCFGSGKTNDSNTTVPSALSTSQSPDVVVCKCCGGAGVMSKSKATACGSQPSSKDDSTISKSTLPPKSAPENVSSVCKPCTPGGSTPVLKSNGPTTCASQVPTTSHSSQEGSSTVTTCKSTTSAPYVCKPCVGIGPSSTTSAPYVCKPCVGIGPSSTTSAPYVCKPCVGIGPSSTTPKLTTAAPNVGSSSICKPCVGIDSTTATTGSTTCAPRVEATKVCKPCIGIGSSTATSTSTTAIPSRTNFGVCKPCVSGTSPAPCNNNSSTVLGSTTTALPSICKPCIGSTNTFGTTCGTSTTRKPDCTSAPSQPGLSTESICKQSGAEATRDATTSGTTTSRPCNTTTTSQSDLSSDKLCKPNVGSSTLSTTTSTSTCKPTGAPQFGGYSSGSMCKPCVGSTTTGTTKGSTTMAPSTCTDTSGSRVSTSEQTTTSRPCAYPTTTSFGSYVDGVCRSHGSGASTKITENSTTTKLPSMGSYVDGVCQLQGSSSSGKVSEVCKLPGGGSTTKIPENSTTSTPGSSSHVDGACKLPNGGSTTKIPENSTTSTPGSTSNVDGICNLSGSGASTKIPGNSTTTTAVPGASSNVESVCKLRSSETSVKIPENSTTTTTVPSASSYVDGVCKLPGSSTPTKTNGNSTSTASSAGTSVDGVCKSPGNGTTTKIPDNLTTTSPCTTAATSGTESFGVCKPCSGSTTGSSSSSTTPASGFTGTCKSSTEIKPPTDNTQPTTSAPDVSSNGCKSNFTSSTTTQPSNSCSNGVTATTLKPSTSCSDSKQSSNDVNKETSCNQQKRSKCVPYTCYTADKSDTTPLPTTPKAYLAKDFDSSSNSTISNDSWRSCYQKCSSKELSIEEQLPSSEPQSFDTPEQDKMKCVPPAVGPCCRAAGVVEFREVPFAKGPACVACEERKDTNGNEIKTETVQEKSSSDQTENESNRERRPSFMQIKGETTIEKRSSLDQIKSESTLQRRPSFMHIKTESPIEKRSSDQYKTGSTLERRPSFMNIKTSSPVERRRSSDLTKSSNNQPVDSKAGPCCSGQSNASTSQPISSGASTPGPCCSEQTKQCNDVTTSRPNDSKSSVGRLCSGNADDSPDEPCGGYQIKTFKMDDNVGTDSTSSASGPIQENVQGCPISIREPCVYSKDNGTSQDTSTASKPGTDSCSAISTPKPSPDTPDTSTTRAMPTFVTPTPPSSQGIICYSKYTNSGGVLVTTSVGKDAKIYDENSSPCVNCKKYQEGKSKTAVSTPSDSQPEIIKCPHKLKRLKDECQGYD